MSATEELPEGVIFVLKNVNNEVNIGSKNRIHPFYMVYIGNSESHSVLSEDSYTVSNNLLIYTSNEDIYIYSVNVCRFKNIRPMSA